MTEAHLRSSSATEAPRLYINGRSYQHPSQPVVVVCFDGCDPEYIAAAKAAGVVPNLTRMMAEGFRR